jgi:hypothetical protein
MHRMEIYGDVSEVSSCGHGLAMGVEIGRTAVFTPAQSRLYHVVFEFNGGTRLNMTCVRRL